MTSNPERAFETPARSRYRTAWGTVTALVVALAAVAGWFTIGWAPLLATTICVAVLGGAFGVAWVEESAARRPAAIRGAWYGAGGALIVGGLPAAIGGWAIAVLIGLAATAPPVVDAALNELGKKRDEQQADDLGRLSDRDLARLWRTTYDAVSSSSSSAAQRLRVAQQRARLLDELERRDPRRFRAWLAASAHTPPSTKPQGR
jgi:hypothetical protein